MELGYRTRDLSAARRWIFAVIDKFFANYPCVAHFVRVLYAPSVGKVLFGGAVRGNIPLCLPASIRSTHPFSPLTQLPLFGVLLFVCNHCVLFVCSHCVARFLPV